MDKKHGTTLGNQEPVPQQKQLSCTLATDDLQKRKETVFEKLRQKVTGVQELDNGYAFRFLGTDQTLDELLEFVKTERICCDFFTFDLSVKDSKSEAWLKLTGGDGVKSFIMHELGF
ncbi:MAG: hypothetical protein MUD08_10180 [Cytophagales bacterium]|jgi:hypothetical protein|nr:hypothetical protein [Cytophagales bacterium]